jgi:leucyl aminopeptidase (aminopeptidase T)
MASKLPTEILVKIFSYLNQTDRHVRVARVSKHWHQTVRYHCSDEIVVSFQGGMVHCDWNMLAEYSWHSVKRLYLIGYVGTIALIATAVRNCSPNIAISYRAIAYSHGGVYGNKPGMMEIPTDKTYMSPYQHGMLGNMTNRYKVKYQRKSYAPL